MEKVERAVPLFSYQLDPQTGATKKDLLALLSLPHRTTWEEASLITY